MFIGNTKQKSNRTTNIRYAPNIEFQSGFLRQTSEIPYEKYVTIFHQYLDSGRIVASNNHTVHCVHDVYGTLFG